MNLINIIFAFSRLPQHQAFNHFYFTKKNSVFTTNRFTNISKWGEKYGGRFKKVRKKMKLYPEFDKKRGGGTSPDLKSSQKIKISKLWVHI